MVTLRMTSQSHSKHIQICQKFAKGRCSPVCDVINKNVVFCMNQKDFLKLIYCEKLKKKLVKLKKKKKKVKTKTKMRTKTKLKMKTKTKIKNKNKTENENKKQKEK